MKKFFLGLVMACLFLSAQACDICGCGVGNYYIGILPHFKSKFIGLRYSFQKYHTRITDDPSQYSNDFFQTTEVWGGFSLGRRVQVLAFLPYQINHQVSDDGTTNNHGLGDAALLVNYRLFDKTGKNANGKLLSQEFYIGAGIKLPTGSFSIDPNDPMLAAMANTQTGSGSTDIMLNTMYSLRSGNWGMNLNGSYKINTVNKDEYQFGNKLATSGFVYYAAKSGHTNISPNLGLQFEHSAGNKISKTGVELTGGHILQTAAGVEFGFKKIAVGLNVQIPLAQNYAGGQTRNEIKGMLHCSFAL